ncbi:hypothetical protein HNR73_000301 [Phytomonospora endophytica]|uniref:Uncharacterized protein n=1 Tax=Phytomonospora endophytica TaxID=714109 RepID=A0A841FII4_9ACTN|nr:hypothetical protein [Phytomonospora endophytica]
MLNLGTSFSKGVGEVKEGGGVSGGFAAGGGGGGQGAWGFGQHAAPATLAQGPAGGSLLARSSSLAAHPRRCSPASPCGPLARPRGPAPLAAPAALRSPALASSPSHAALRDPTPRLHSAPAQAWQRELRGHPSLATLRRPGLARPPPPPPALRTRAGFASPTSRPCLPSPPLRGCGCAGLRVSAFAVLFPRRLASAPAPAQTSQRELRGHPSLATLPRQLFALAQASHHRPHSPALPHHPRRRPSPPAFREARADMAARASRSRSSLAAPCTPPSRPWLPAFRASEGSAARAPAARRPLPHPRGAGHEGTRAVAGSRGPASEGRRERPGAENRWRGDAGFATQSSPAHTLRGRPLGRGSAGSRRSPPASAPAWDGPRRMRAKAGGTRTGQRKVTGNGEHGKGRARKTGDGEAQASLAVVHLALSAKPAQAWQRGLRGAALRSPPLARHLPGLGFLLSARARARQRGLPPLAARRPLPHPRGAGHEGTRAVAGSRGPASEGRRERPGAKNRRRGNAGFTRRSAPRVFRARAGPARRLHDPSFARRLA